MNSARPSITTQGFSLRAPISSEDDRELFQRRVAMTSLLVFVLAGGFWLVTLVSVIALAPAHLHHMWSTTTAQVQLVTTFTGLVLWAMARFGKRNVVALEVIDCICAVGLCLGWALMTTTETANVRPELIGLLASSYTLVLRAALIPSTPARTALLGFVAFVPLVALTHLHYAGGREPGSPIGATTYVAIWSLLGVAATTVISWVIYGLRAQVRKAMQLGQYQLEQKIGEGGMGAVYRASHAMLRRPTAIKLLSEATVPALERFEREVQITARLTHPNTIAIFDYGRTPDGLFYYAMEYVDGISLEELVELFGPQPAARVVHVLRQACGALSEAHSAGLVHRDVKPANIMLTTRGGIRDVVKVLDFGLVKENQGDDSGPNVTKSNVILGTPHYMAPEAITDPRSVDGRADLYALGATAFFMLTGRRVFEGTSVLEVCGKQLHQAPEPPVALKADVPAALSEIVVACLAKKRDDRPTTAAALSEALGALNIAEWTNADAEAWWAEHQRPSRDSGEAGRRVEEGRTVAVALAGRV